MSAAPSSDLLARSKQTVPGLGAATGALEAAGHGAWLVGQVLLRVLARQPVETSEPVMVWTTAPVDAIARLFERATPLGEAPLVWRIPNGPRPLHVRSIDGPIDAALGRMPLRVLALGLRPATGELCDPAEGLADLRAGALRELGDPAQHAQRDPLLVLRAARLAAAHALHMDPRGVERLEGALPALERAPAAHLATMMRAVLLGASADHGTALLEAVGLRHAWLGRPPLDPAPRVAELPRDFALRLLAWSAGGRPALLLRRMRLDAGVRERLVRLAEHHPVEERHPSLRPRTIRRLLEQLGADDVDALIALRRAELRAAPPDEGNRDAGERLDALADACATFKSPAARGPSLAVGGRDLIDSLGVSPGPLVGRLLAALEDEVIAGGVDNERTALLERARTIFAGEATHTDDRRTR